METIWGRLGAAGAWTLVVVGGAPAVGESLSTTGALVLFAISSLAFGFLAGRFWPLLVPLVLALGLVIWLWVGSPCDSDDNECSVGLAVALIVAIFAPAATALIAIGVVARRLMSGPSE